MNRLFFAFGTTVLLTGAAACGDDSSATGEECGEHGQPECPVSDDWTSKTGGEIRLEMRYLPDGTSQQVVSQAWFITEQNPERLPRADFGHCTEVMGFTNSFNAANAMGTRTYKEVGDTVTFDNGTDDPIVLSHEDNTNDFRGLEHPEIYAENGMTKGGTDPELVSEGIRYAIDFANGETIDEGIFMPGLFTEKDSSDLKFEGEPLTFDPTGEISWEFDYPDDDAEFAFIAFSGQGELWVCLDFVDDGKITIPADDLARIPNEGAVLAATVSHQKINYDERNLDVIGINCKINTYEYLAAE